MLQVFKKTKTHGFRTFGTWWYGLNRGKMPIRIHVPLLNRTTWNKMDKLLYLTRMLKFDAIYLLFNIDLHLLLKQKYFANVQYSSCNGGTVRIK